MVREVIWNGFRTCAAGVMSSWPLQLHGPYASMNVLSAVDPRIIYDVVSWPLRSPELCQGCVDSLVVVEGPCR